MKAPGEAAPLELTHEVASFLYREARLLDEERFSDWLNLLTADIHYWLPVRENRYRNDKRPPPSPNESASVYNDDFDDLKDRVSRFETGLAWTDDPPARVRRIVSNVEVEATDKPDEFAAYSNFLVYRNRRQREEGWFVGARRDRLRRSGEGWRLARRHILLDQHVFLDENLSLFF